MRLSTILPNAFLFLYASAFSSYMGPQDSYKSGNLKKRQVPFDPVAQKIDVTGDHVWVAPRPSDLRGPCPGLNVLANHGYIQRNGITNLAEVVDAAQLVFGIGLDLALALRYTTYFVLSCFRTFILRRFSLVTSVFGVILTGDPITEKFSIGGPPPLNLFEQLTSILYGRPQGLSGSHNTYESDSSATRGDSYLFNGDVSSLRLEYVQDILRHFSNMSDCTSSSVWIKYRIKRFEHSVEKNPYFWFGPISGIAVSEAGPIFIPELYANRSAASPDTGTLLKSVMLSFLGVDTDASGQLMYTPGHERIPKNWYRRSIDDPFSFLDFIEKVTNIIFIYPRAGSIGGNTGTVDSFLGVDPSDLTGGVFNATDLTDKNKLSCFLYRVSQALAPQMLQDLFTTTIVATGLLNTNWFGLFTGLGCPQLSSVDQSMLAQFPGAKPGKPF